MKMLFVRMPPDEVVKRIRSYVPRDQYDPFSPTKSAGTSPILLGEVKDSRCFTLRARTTFPSLYGQELVARLAPLNGGTRIEFDFAIPRARKVLDGVLLVLFVGLPLFALIGPGSANRQGLLAFLGTSIFFLVVLPLVSRVLEHETDRLQGFLSAAFPEADRAGAADPGAVPSG